MGFGDWFAEYVNPFDNSNREQAEKDAQNAKRQADAQAQTVQTVQESLTPWLGPQVSTVGQGPGPSGNADVDRWMGLYGLGEYEASAEFIGPGGKRMRIGEYLDRLHQLDRPGVEAEQRAFFRAGFYGDAKASDIRWGQMDQLTVGATARAALEAARYGVDGKTGLAEVVEGAAGAARSGAGGGPPVSSPGTAEAELRAAMSDLLGRKPNAREVRRFHRRLNAAERGGQPAPEPGGEAEFDLDTDEIQDGSFAEGDRAKLAEEEILRENGVEANAYRMGTLTSAFENLMLGG